MIHSYKDLIVWQKSMELVVCIYEITDKFPEEETYGLAFQMRRSSISIPSNIAEGRLKGTKKDFLQFLRVAYSSGAELETQTEVSKRVLMVEKSHYYKSELLLLEVMKMINSMIGKLNIK